LKSATAALIAGVVVGTIAVPINAALAPDVVSRVVAGIIAGDPRSQLREALGGDNSDGRLNARGSNLLLA
jgi:hypothetical protein